MVEATLIRMGYSSFSCGRYCTRDGAARLRPWLTPACAFAVSIGRPSRPWPCPPMTHPYPRPCMCMQRVHAGTLCAPASALLYVCTFARCRLCPRHAKTQPRQPMPRAGSNQCRTQLPPRRPPAVNSVTCSVSFRGEPGVIRASCCPSACVPPTTATACPLLATAWTCNL